MKKNMMLRVFLLIFLVLAVPTGVRGSEYHLDSRWKCSNESVLSCLPIDVLISSHGVVLPDYIYADFVRQLKSSGVEGGAIIIFVYRVDSSRIKTEIYGLQILMKNSENREYVSGISGHGGTPVQATREAVIKFLVRINNLNLNKK